MNSAAQSRSSGKERDSETGLDYFGARYYGSNMGRFLSPDEFTGGPIEPGAIRGKPGPLPYADIVNPQSLNKYGYTYNNPLRYVDPDGHSPNWWQLLKNTVLHAQFATDEERNDQHRDWLVKNVSSITIDGKTYSKQDFLAASREQVSTFFDAAQKDINQGNVSVAAATFGPESLQRDPTGRIHTELPDRIPDNWSRAELEQARDELKQSIKARLQQEADHGGPDAAHMGRIRQEQQLLRQIEDKLGNK